MNQTEQLFFNDLEKKLWTAADKLRAAPNVLVESVLPSQLALNNKHALNCVYSFNAVKVVNSINAVISEPAK